MKTNLSMLAAAVALTLSMGATTANSEQATTPTPDGFGCTYNFTSTNLKWCVNVGGQLQKLESPAGAEHIQAGTILEGFLLCINNVPTYWDTGATNSNNMSAGSVLVAPSASAVSVTRTTNDGKFKIDHKWSRDATERDLTLQMTVQNVSGGAVPSVRLFRIADIDANSQFGTNGFDKSRLGTWIREQEAVSLAGLTLTLAPVTAITTFATAATSPPPCSPASLGVPSVGDSAAWVGYDFGTMSNLAKKIVKFAYQVQ